VSQVAVDDCSRGERRALEVMVEEIYRDGHYTRENGRIKLGAEPDVEAARVYEDLVRVYGTCERQAIAIYYQA